MDSTRLEKQAVSKRGSASDYEQGLADAVDDVAYLVAKVMTQEKP